MTTFRTWIGILLVAGLPPGLLWWFLLHPLVGMWRRLGVKVSLWTIGILMGGLLVGLFFIRDALLGPDLGMSWPLMAVGLALVVGAGVMGAKRKRHLTLDILSGAPELQPDGKGGTLLTEGPYAVIRHPRYVEVALAVFGYAFLSNYLGAYVMALLCIPVIHLIVLLEERELARRFGSAWEEYLARVPRYIPRRRAV